MAARVSRRRDKRQVLALVVLALAGALALELLLPPRAAVPDVDPAVATRQPVAPAPAPTPKPSAPAPKPAAAPEPVTPEPYTIRRVLKIDGPLRHGDWVWNEDGAPRTGRLVITIDLDAQVLSAFRDGYEIGTAAVTYGADSKPTPLGVFPITQKDARHVSNLYGAPMPYMLRLTQDGVSIHAGEVNALYATHGCVGVPLPFAKRLFAAAKLGDRVIITNGERLHLGQDVPAA